MAIDKNEIRHIGSLVTRLAESELDDFYSSLTPVEMMVIIKILAQSFASSQFNWDQPGLLELKAKIIEKYHSLDNFAKQFPLTPEDTPTINAILPKLLKFKAKWASHGN